MFADVPFIIRLMTKPTQMYMGEVKNFQNPELKKFNFLNLQDAYKMNNFMFKWLIVFR